MKLFNLNLQWSLGRHTQLKSGYTMDDSGFENVSERIVAPALSTIQNEDTFSFQKYKADIKQREGYLGKYTENELSDKLFEYYNVQELIEYFKKHPEYHKITLQFPDSLIQDSTIVVKLLQQHLQDNVPYSEVGNNATNGSKMNEGGVRKFWVLADTAYSACCVDEVASEHVKSQIVVHFGDACLNAIQKLPVIYSFGKSFLEVNNVIEKFKEQYPDYNSKVCLMSDLSNCHNISNIYEILKQEGYKELLISDINTSLINEKVKILGNSAIENKFKNIYTVGNRIIYSETSDIEITSDDHLREEYQLLHITVPQDPHLLYLTTIFQSVTLFNTKENSLLSGPFPSLMKRYKYMHVARTAGCIGILINTLSLKNTKETINKLVKLIRSKGKKHYLFVVGKPNVAKLANFEPVDIWCVLGCGQSGIILDQYNEFYKPIITPYELTMALNEEVTWTGKWLVDFKEALADIEDEDESQIENLDALRDLKTESEAPEFDAVTGKYISNSRPLRNVAHLEIEGPSSINSSTELIKNVSGGVIIKGTVSTSASRLQSRQWSGLGSDFKDQEEYEEDGATLEEGISGVARGYQFDRNSS